jgi:hypothetical protein
MVLSTLNMFYHRRFLSICKFDELVEKREDSGGKEEEGKDCTFSFFICCKLGSYSSGYEKSSILVLPVHDFVDLIIRQVVFIPEYG